MIRHLILKRWCKRAGIEVEPDGELLHLRCIIARVRRAEASQLDLLHLADLIDPDGFAR
jgi:hypothetical protein